MSKITVKKEAYVKYQLTTWQGEVEVNGQHVTYRYSEDDNGIEFYILTNGNWEVADLENENINSVYSAILMYGNPEEFGSVGEEVEVDEDFI